MIRPFHSSDFDAAGENVGIKRRRAGEREDRAVFDIERDDGALLAFERLVGGLPAAAGPKSDEPCSRERR